MSRAVWTAPEACCAGSEPEWWRPFWWSVPWKLSRYVTDWFLIRLVWFLVSCTLDVQKAQTYIKHLSCVLWNLQFLFNMYIRTYDTSVKLDLQNKIIVVKTHLILSEISCYICVFLKQISGHSQPPKQRKHETFSSSNNIRTFIQLCFICKSLWKKVRLSICADFTTLCNSLLFNSKATFSVFECYFFFNLLRLNSFMTRLQPIPSTRASSTESERSSGRKVKTSVSACDSPDIYWSGRVVQLRTPC